MVLDAMVIDLSIQTGADNVIIQVSVGPLVNKTRSLSYDTPFTSFFDVFTVVTPGNYSISFEGTGGDNIGMLLDDVQLNAIPEPTTIIIWSLLGAFCMTAGRLYKRTA